jgi:hypothetical protein
MGAIRERLLQIIENKRDSKISKASLARKMGCVASEVSHLLSGERELSEKWILKFCDALEITLSDLEMPKMEETESEKNRRILHGYFDAILRNGGDRANWLSGNVLTFYSEMTGKKPDSSVMPSKTQENCASDSGHGVYTDRRSRNR